MTKKQYILQIIKLFFKNSAIPTPEKRYILVILALCSLILVAGVCATFANPFELGWSFHASLAIILLLEMTAIVLRVRSIIKQSKANERHEQPPANFIHPPQASDL